MDNKKKKKYLIMRGICYDKYKNKYYYSSV